MWYQMCEVLAVFHLDQYIQLMLLLVFYWCWCWVTYLSDEELRTSQRLRHSMVLYRYIVILPRRSLSK